MFDRAYLEDTRRAFATYFPEEVVIERIVDTDDDGFAGRTVTREEVERVAAAKGAPRAEDQEKVVADQRQGEKLVPWRLPAETDIRLNDRILHGGLVYEVVGERGDHSNAAERVVLTVERGG